MGEQGKQGKEGLKVGRKDVFIIPTCFFVFYETDFPMLKYICNNACLYYFYRETEEQTVFKVLPGLEVTR